MANIFNIELDYLRLMNEIEDAQGEITEEMETFLVINEQDAKDKLNSYAHIITLKESDITIAKDEIVRLQKRIDGREKLIARLEKTMIQAVKMFGTEGKPSKITGLASITFDTGKFTLTVGKSKGMVGNDDEKVTADNFSDDSYNQYTITRKFTNAQIDTITDLLSHSDRVDILLQNDDLKRSVDTAQLKNDLLNGTVVSEGQVETEGIEIDEVIAIDGNQDIHAITTIEDTRPQVNAYIVINEKLKIK